LGGWLKTTWRKVSGGFILFLIIGIYSWYWQQSRSQTELTVLPLNGGHAVFVDAAGQENDWLVNCGDGDAVAFTLKPFLRAQGVNRISRLVLTEGDIRNIGGAQALDELFGVRELVTSPVHFRSTAYRDVVAKFEQPPARHRIAGFGDTMGCWRILAPLPTNTFSQADDNALVLLGDFQGTRILLLSDLGRGGQSALLQHTNDLRADIVIAGLPNAGEPLCNAVLEAVQPKVMVIADSEFPANRRAGRELKERLSGRNVPVIYTRTAGAVTIVTWPGGWELRAMDGTKFGY